ncbi:MFS transporter [Extensimonas vulgaris]|uniref:MFS transporter n=1 Tax=Extensimonas vulgaris TaxID=1031594 RepID=A0A369AJ07_9BURK|nr:MFS transporter [Extensimonas vulgaris]RCX08266.1 MFS transporter [Extensimonas vulgaris]TWI37462.1 MFS transporter [Extensimonas vulgaris]TXD13855.1 MFS transporter [Extensimonas vulgaris]
MIPYAPREWRPEERPMMPGSPSTPAHPPHLRVAYGVVGCLIAITGGMSNALVTAYQQYLQGALGATSVEIAWLVAAYIMTNISMNLLLVKFRQEFGLRIFTEAFLILYTLIAFGHLFVNSLSSAIAVRAAHGMTGAALSSLGMYYTMQAFPNVHRIRGLALALGMSTLALPLARVLPFEMLSFAEWRGLYLFEMGLSLMCLGCVLLLKLPPGDLYKTFEKLDFVTFILFAPGMALLCGSISLGRTVWWFEAQWMGWALAAAIVLLTAAMLIEHLRNNPLINLRWWGSSNMVRLAMIVIMVRFVLSEQSTTGAVGLMQSLGLTPEQMHPMFFGMLLGTLAGILTSVLTIDREHLMEPIIVALALIMVGAFMDAHATNLTRPAEMVLSQFLTAFGGALFLAPAMVQELGSVRAEPRNLVSFSVLFSISQNMGGQVGSALLGTFQVWREKFHSSHIVEHLTLLDPQVATRVQQSANSYKRVLTDPVLDNTQGLKALATAATREANVLAYNDVFLLVAVIAGATLFFLLAQVVWKRTTRATA